MSGSLEGDEKECCSESSLQSRSGKKSEKRGMAGIDGSESRVWRPAGVSRRRLC